MNPRPRAAPHGALRAPDEAFAFEGLDDEPGERQDATETTGRGGGPWKKVLAALRLGLGLSLVIGTSVSVAYSVRHYALTSPRFAIREVHLIGGKRVSPQQAQEQAGVVLDGNVFALDTAVAEKKLLENPWIAEARVTRDLPRTLRIEIKERQAAALS